jgi:tRNA A-37 threonylcarbamoyl transferase component Bud32
MPDNALANATKFRWARETRPARAAALWRNPLLLAGLALAALLVVAGFWIHHATEEALRDKLREGLDTVAATSAAALTFWIENELSSAHDWAELPDVAVAARGLAGIASGSANPGPELLASAQHAELLATLQPLSESEDYDGFGLVGRDGTVLAASIGAQVGRRLTADGMALLARVLQGQKVLTRPYQQGDMLVAADMQLDVPRMSAVAPVHDEQGTVIGAFYLIIRPEKDFTRILSIARLGETGDTYAFDQDGVMLSDSRHDQQLKVIGLLPDEPAARSILRVQVRDPGGDLTRGYRPDTPPAGRPLTKLVAAAVSGDSPAQVILEPYRDYRGVPVVGAWRWLPQHGIGLATEVAVDAAFAAARPLRVMVFGLLGLLLLSAVLILVASVAVQFLRRRVEQVKQLGQYTLERKLGAGGMGEVYLARHALLRRPTAVKFIRPEQVSEQNLARFEREVQLTSELTSPHTIEIYDFGCTEEGVFYYVMEYLPGLDLGDLLELQGAVPAGRAVFILKQLCSSLAEAHARGLIHRDIKPPNVILTERGGGFDFVKVLDFGLVKDVGNPEAGEDTQVHELAGTPPYIAPERIRDPDCQDPRSDLFSVGVIAFNLLTGKQPFEGSTAMEMAYHVVNTPAPRVSERSQQAIPAPLDQLVADCLAADPEKRPADAEAIIARLDALELAEPWDQQAARSWWAANAKRLGTAGHDVAVSAARSMQQVADALRQPVSE